MADYVEGEEENSVEKIDNNALESLENSQKIAQDEFIDNAEEVCNLTEKLAENNEEICEEKFNIANDNDPSLTKLQEDEKIAELETSVTNENDIVNSTEKEKEPEVVIAETNNILVVEKDLETTPKVEDVSEIFCDTARLVNDIPLENSEFRHRHSREKVENTEESSPSRSTVRFESVVQENEENDVFQELKQDVSHVESLPETRQAIDTTSKSKSKSHECSVMVWFSHRLNLKLITVLIVLFNIIVVIS